MCSGLRTAEHKDGEVNRACGRYLGRDHYRGRLDDPILAPSKFECSNRIGGCSFQMCIMLYGGLAALALLLATIGIYGVMAFTVMQRTAEIGLRMALGAGHDQVRLRILREGATLATVGLILGLMGAYAPRSHHAKHALRHGTLILPVILATGMVLLGTALAACYVPARRASAVDPLIALRQS